MAKPLSPEAPSRPIGPEIETWIQEQWSKFPQGAAGKALTLSVLYKMQEKYGSVDVEVYDAVAARLGVPASHVKGVATFYTMLNKKPVGRYHLQVCTNIGCMLDGAYELFEHCKVRLGVQNRGTTSDDNITLSEVECLAACGFGPVAQIAERSQPEIPLYFENLDVAKVDKILDALAEGKVPTELGR